MSIRLKRIQAYMYMGGINLKQVPTCVGRIILKLLRIKTTNTK